LGHEHLTDYGYTILSGKYNEIFLHVTHS